MTQPTYPIVAGAEAWSHEGQGRHGALCLHGFTGNPSSMRGLADAFAGAGYHVELPRLPGHGTHIDEMLTTSWKDWSTAAEEAYRRLAQRAEKVVVAGLSMGGTLSLWLAAEHPELAGIVCINPAAQLMPSEMMDMVRAMIAEGQTIMPGIGNDIAQPDIVESAYEMTPLQPLVSLVDEGLATLEPRLGSIRVPLLLLNSPQDHVVPPEQSDALASAYGGPVERIILERSYHVATQDFDKDLIEAEAIAFADRVTA